MAPAERTQSTNSTTLAPAATLLSKLSWRNNRVHYLQRREKTVILATHATSRSRWLEILLSVEPRLRCSPAAVRLSSPAPNL